LAWIESHQELDGHPKVTDLMGLMGWDKDQVIGKLHRFWWWCLKYAQNGDLRKHNDNRIAEAMGVAMGDSKRLIEAMVQSCWIDRKPYFRVHDWWDYAGRFLQGKYSHSPSEWKTIRKAYGYRKVSDTTYLPNLPTNQPYNSVMEKPTAEQVRAYALTLGYPIDAEKFVDYYGVRGWRTKGGQIIRDWKHCVSTWKRNTKMGKENGQKLAVMATGVGVKLD
jgi:hypothetical protein